MHILQTLCVVFGFAWLLHFVIWKVRLPHYEFQAKALLVIFSVVLCAWLASPFARATPMLVVLNVVASYIPLMLGYIVLYTVVHVDSPTLALMRFIAESGSQGRSSKEVAAFFAARPFVKARLATLANPGMIRERDGRWVVAGKGSLPFRFILSYRKLYGPISQGG